MTDTLTFSNAQKPGPVVLTGHYGRVEKLDPARHGAALWTEMKVEPTLWDYMSYGPFQSEEQFQSWLAERASLTDPYAYAVVAPDGRALGIAALMRITPEMGVIEVGHITYSPALQRTPLGTEAQFLLARYAFDTLGYRRYEWKCNALNAASRRAAERYGFTFEGTFRQHMIVKGKNRDTAWYSIIDTEWPARRASFERWLAPSNFEAQGRQKASLASFMTASG
ncbi:GNAT family protein [Pseudorhodoplanes sp.]|uniref:GNAT family N-acetyltransferase n=1 Tax=Pseudorhodoplanes sp. TaxID=1934341 RepID=UPI002B6C531A|nr:GNAT family protein [Pseudorhodoplanes sp.]HWV54174.1 GNAT family protein [Pseudorhodoplanes sp.]